MTAAKPRVAFPACCSVAVVCGEHLMSQVYPAAVPLEMFLDDVVELVDDDLRRRGETGLESAVAYELRRANGVRLDVTRTLDELGVEDGATLILAVAEDGESFEPHYESLSTGLARVGKQLFPPVTPRVATQTAIAILGLVTLTVLGLVGVVRLSRDTIVPGAFGGGYGILLAAGAMAVLRWWPDRRDLLGGLAWLAVPALAAGAALSAPGGIAAPHAFLAALTTLVATCAATAVTSRSAMGAATVVVLCGIVGLLSAARMWRAVPTQLLGMCTLVGLLVLLTLAPTIALWAARIRPPHFGSITGRDLFCRRDGMPVDAVSPVETKVVQAKGVAGKGVAGKGVEGKGVEGKGTADADATPSGAAIAESAQRANAVLTGVRVAAAVALPPAVWATLTPPHTHGPAAGVLSALFVVIFVSRARVFTARRQAVPLVLGAAAAVCAGVTRHVAGSMPDAAAMFGALLLVGFAGVALTAALVIPAASFTPLVRTAAEWLELLAIVAALPLAGWIGGLFSWVRMR